MAAARTDWLRRDNGMLLAKLALIAVAMFGFGYAMVPLYRAICDTLGINVLSLSEQKSSDFGAARASTQVDLSRTITVEFDANARGPWDFRPAQRSVQVHPGELTTVMYEFRNIQDRVMSAQAIPSYAPKQAAAHFNKLECFCFSEHTLAPGESKTWPVVFVVDSKLPRDVTTITLSYTFFEVTGKSTGGRKGGAAL
jgi:cytochrome c oxidase assembly protein subunit 11